MHLYNKRYPLLSRIVFYTFLLASLVSMLALTVQLYMTFVVQKKEIVNALNRLETSQLNTLINNVWSLDREAIEIQLKSILDAPDIVYIWLEFVPSLVNERFTFGVEPLSGSKVLTREYDLIRQVNGQNVLIGRVGFVATTENIASRLLQAASKNLAAELITVGVTCLFMLVLFIVLYSNHINRIVLYTETLDVGQLDQELILKRSRSNKQKDEIDQIVDALNTMRIRVKKDIQARDLAEKQLAEEKMFSDTIINSLPGIFFVIDRDLKIVRHNHLYLEFFRLTDTEVGNHDYTACVIEGQREEVLAAIEDLFAHKEPLLLEMNVIGGNGQATPFIVTAQLLERGDTEYLVAIGSDLTAQKRMESQFRQTQKMESLGLLAGGISHDFNNILTAIVGYTNLAKLESGGHEKLERYLDTIEEASARAKELVQQILSFSRNTESGCTVLQVSKIVREALQLLRSSLPSTIQIDQSIDSELQVLGDATEIHQVVMNLCTNAYHAMQETGGILSVKVYEHVVWGQETLPESEMIPGMYLAIEIADTGQGINEEIRGRIFEPYFTTKDAGVGTGLGLAVVHGIISKYNGYIHVDTMPGKGTTFIIYLPAVVDGGGGKNEVEKTSVDHVVPRGQGQHILVVDDEAIILELYADILSRYGYTVTCFADSTESLQHFLENQDRYDLAIIDQMMPNIKGDQLAEKIWEKREGFPIILCSGFAGALGRHEFIKKGFAEYLQKPVSGVILLETINDALAS